MTRPGIEPSSPGPLANTQTIIPMSGFNNTIITNKILRKTHLKELHTTLHQREYPTTLINERFELVEKIPQKELQNPKKKKKNP